MPPFILSLLYLLAVALVFGVLLWGLNRVPWIDADVRAFLRVVFIVVFAIYFIWWVYSLVAGGLLSGPGPGPYPYRR